MTGYGKACAQWGGKKIHAEIKSLNSKSLDLSTRIAPLYREKEMEIRAMITQALERGKVDFNLWVEKDETQAGASINPAVVKNYVDQIARISVELGIETPSEHLWDVIVRLPEVTATTTVEELTDEEWTAAREAVKGAIDQLVAFRRQEGAALERKFAEKLDNIEALLASIEPYETARVEKIRTRITDRLSELTGVDYDKNRLEQELIYYIEKLDISEEKQRLTNHLKYFRETMADGHGQGKKLGFIAQEMGREINTTGSKSNQAEMQNIVVKMKDELEQIKEQVLNVM
jgi:uncharacterized protein (TIGR00255 family)